MEFSSKPASHNWRMAGLSPQEISRRLARSRRDFLRDATGVAIGSAFLGASPFVRAATAVRKRKVIVVTFGGGARDQETFAPQGQVNIPHMLGELIRQASFFTQVVNRGILGHYVATASLATGVYETLNNFSAVPPDHPTPSSSTSAKTSTVLSPTPGSSRPATASIASAKAMAASTAQDLVPGLSFRSAC